MATRTRRECILAVDDAAETLELLQRVLSAHGYRVLVAPGAAEAMRILEDHAVDLVITDYKMPEVDGIDFMRHVRDNYKNTEVMMITGYPSIPGAIDAFKSGSQEYITKPFTEEELVSAVQGVLGILAARREATAPPEDASASRTGIIGESPAMQKVFRSIGKAAATRATVLITGESGTGKELVARSIHYGSQRSSAGFVPVNCSSIPENLLESELFGHVKGAFTGANETRAGFFQTADGGTIFLDEIGDTSLPMQAKLLRVLQSGEVYMVGSARPREVDVRVLAATNKDLQILIKNRLFREDLFYRLNVIFIAMPPLRERGNDLLLLASHFLQEYADDFGQAVPHFSDRALQVLLKYNWPGNVRELENLVQSLVVMVEGDRIDVPDLPSYMRFSLSSNGVTRRTLAEVEAEHIRNVMASVDGNKTKAAEILGIHRKTLREKLREHPDEPA